MDTIYVTQEEYDKMCHEIEMLNQEIEEAHKSRVASLSTEKGFAGLSIPTVNAEVYRLMSKLNRKLEMLENVQVVANNHDDNVVDIGDKVLLSFGDYEEAFLLVGTVTELSQDSLHCISVSSPIGKAIYKGQVGQSVSYQVGGNIETLTIVELTKSYEESTALK